MPGMTILEGLVRWLRGQGTPVDELGTLVDERIDDVAYRVSGRLTRRRRASFLWLELQTTTAVADDRWRQELPLVPGDRLLAAMADVGRRIAAGQGAREDPGARVAAALLRLPELGLVHSWEGLDGAPHGDPGRRLDLHLVVAETTGRYWLVFTGRGAGSGRWPPAVAEALVARRDQLQPSRPDDV